ncbi:uncharacterized protein PRCAT00006059001 [Priceomyces carsonii]|uniref:uncharacterized protein n=1 Tax=Priceomyces carsonii TaxID=28549 RepID=UPI002EDA2AE8|nr:unnamed protein product [Priceomyces carsonii]
MSGLVFQNFDERSESDGEKWIEGAMGAQLLRDIIDGDDDEDFYEDFNKESPDVIKRSLPEHACVYCGIHTPNCVVKCVTCDKWFCNAKSGLNTSHIVTHMIMSKHNVVALHEESDLGDTTLECYNCGNKNVFILGFVSAKLESVVVILCRIPCAQSKDVNWDTSQWQSLIENRQLLLWVASEPSEEDIENSKIVSHSQITKLETQWKLHRDATIDEIETNDDGDEEVLPILLRYDDAFQYQRSFAPLVKLEADANKALKESQALEHIQVKWALGLNNRHLASFIFSTFESNDLRVAVGDEMILRYSGSDYEPWEGRGFIVRVPNAYYEYFTLELTPSKSPPPVDQTRNFTAEFVWKGTSYDRMQQALRKFALNKESVSSYVYHKLLGHEVEPVEFDIKIPRNISLSKLATLNESQVNAVKSSLVGPFTLIQGPPGTGKTVTSATIVYHLSSKGKILVTAPSNVAVDHLAAKLDVLGLKVVRLTAKSREDVDSSVSHLALHNLVNKAAKGELKKLIALRNQVGELSDADAKALIRKVRKMEEKILNKCNVVCCTCVGAADKRLSKLTFRSVLIDESTHASEPEVLIPIVKGAKQVILVGDHQQMGPVIFDKKAGDAGLRQSLFERLVLLGNIPNRLDVQYRMHPCLSEYPSNVFYEGTLQNGVTSESRLLKHSKFPWPVENTPMMFWANYGKEEFSGNGSSLLNRVEAMNVEKIITKLFEDGVNPEQIGVITPYEGQRAYIVQYMSMNSTLTSKREQYLEIEVTSVDAFQGREKDFIILSCVRGNDQQNIGFLSDPRRLNVALTRAKFGLVILGNPRALCRNSLWNHLLVHFREMGSLVDGPLDNLQLSMVQLNSTSKSVGLQRKSFPGSKFSADKRDFDTESIVSFAPEGSGHHLKQSQWPAFSRSSQNNSHANSRSLTSNFANKLNKLNDDFDGRYIDNDIEDDIRSISANFTAGLNFN